MDAIRTVALAAVAEVGSAWNGGAKVAQAMKLVRDRTGCRLTDARKAVEWAIERPAAATLPIESVVAGEGCVFIKVKADEPTLPWRGFTGGAYVNQYGDDEITDMIQRDEASILRIGTGE